ncbi:MAG: hypothetical protein D6B26_01105 [Spirochaetaceae bacterium]|nr:MAG: hypothetical protein D6B26_01105 [Spirochaetaceae bacterium]
MEETNTSAAAKEAASVLAQAFKDSPVYEAFVKASEELNQDEAALKLLDTLQQMGADEAEMQLQGNDLLKRFFGAQQAIIDLAVEINQMISGELGFDYASQARSGCCS